jgi:hypothetical protein
VLDTPLRTIVGCLAEVLPIGPAQTALYWVAGLCILAAPFIYKYYLGILAQGAQPEGSIERQDYDKLRASLAGGNLATRLYAKWLTKFLDRVERFFGDAGTEGQRAFGLKTPAPLWTAPALDRCLLLALLYPIATIFVIWAISGHVGPAEATLGLLPNVPTWRRGTAAAMFGIADFAIWWRATPKHSAWHAATRVVTSVGVGAFAGACVWAGAIAIAGVSGFAGTFISVGAGICAGLFAVACAITLGRGGTDFPAIAGAGAVTFSLTGAIFGGVVGSVTFGFTGAAAFTIACGVLLLSLLATAIKYRSHGLFLSFFLPAMIMVCLSGVNLLSPLKTWGGSGPMLLFLGLLTLLNAPFDWVSLGLTRALLRRGLELGGWWPYLLALVDAALAAVIIACLALVMVIGVQAFDELAVHGGGEQAAVLPIDKLFDGIANNPAAPEYWWAYALLLSSMIPSIINLAIGGMAFTRGIPWLARLLLQWIPEGKAVPEYKRQPAAIGLTVQMFAGAFLGIAAQALLAWGLIFHVMPWIGLDLLDMARAVAVFDLPMQLWQIFARIL